MRISDWSSDVCSSDLLRVRQIGGKRIQTLKLPVDFDTGLQIHREIEFEIDGDTPILSSIDDAPLKAFFTANATAGQLAAVFVTEFAPRIWPLHMFDTEHELALDPGVIPRENGKAP